jgi:hypothetical protein
MENPLTLDEVIGFIDTIKDSEWTQFGGYSAHQLYANINPTTKVNIRQWTQSGLFKKKKIYELRVSWRELGSPSTSDEIELASFSGKEIEPIYQSISARLSQIEEAKSKAQREAAIMHIRSMQ